MRSGCTVYGLLRYLRLIKHIQYIEYSIQRFSLCTSAFHAGQKIKQLEQKWGSEVKALKQESLMAEVYDVCYENHTDVMTRETQNRAPWLQHEPLQSMWQDLHRTILAHNHNSDLMRHHRDALDEAVLAVLAVLAVQGYLRMT